MVTLYKNHESNRTGLSFHVVYLRGTMHHLYGINTPGALQCGVPGGDTFVQRISESDNYGQPLKLEECKCKRN